MTAFWLFYCISCRKISVRDMSTRPRKVNDIIAVYLPGYLKKVIGRTELLAAAIFCLPIVKDSVYNRRKELFENKPEILVQAIA